MWVQDFMTRSPVITRPGECVSEALRVMHHHSIKHLPVLGESHHLVGIVSQSDCMIGLNLVRLPEVLPKSDLRVRDVMSRAPIVTTPTEDVFVAAARMYENQVGCLPVMVDETLVGILTASDLLVACINITKRQSQNGSAY